MYIIRLSLARSEAETASVRRAILYEFQFGVQYAWMLLIFAMTTIYSISCPLITPFGEFRGCGFTPHKPHLPPSLLPSLLPSFPPSLTPSFPPSLLPSLSHSFPLSLPVTGGPGCIFTQHKPPLSPSLPPSGIRVPYFHHHHPNPPIWGPDTQNVRYILELVVVNQVPFYREYLI